MLRLPTEQSSWRNGEGQGCSEEGAGAVLSEVGQQEGTLCAGFKDGEGSAIDGTRRPF